MAHPNVTDSYDVRTAKEAMDYYASWSKDYDQQVHQEGYRGPQLLVEMVVKHCPDHAATILDIGAGSGLVGEALAKLGYRNIDAHDGSEEMLALAQNRHVYSNLYHELFEKHQPCKTIPANSYDVAIAVGIFAPGHLEVDQLDVLLHPVKPGGLIIFGVNERWTKNLDSQYAWWSSIGMEEKINAMAEHGKWKLLDKEVKPNYLGDIAGVYYALQKL